MTMKTGQMFTESDRLRMDQILAESAWNQHKFAQFWYSLSPEKTFIYIQEKYNKKSKQKCFVNLVQQDKFFWGGIARQIRKYIW